MTLRKWCVKNIGTCAVFRHTGENLAHSFVLSVCYKCASVLCFTSGCLQLELSLNSALPLVHIWGCVQLVFWRWPVRNLQHLMEPSGFRGVLFLKSAISLFAGTMTACQDSHFTEWLFAYQTLSQRIFKVSFMLSLSSVELRVALSSSFLSCGEMSSCPVGRIHSQHDWIWDKVENWCVCHSEMDLKGRKRSQRKWCKRVFVLFWWQPVWCESVERPRRLTASVNTGHKVVMRLSATSRGGSRFVCNPQLGDLEAANSTLVPVCWALEVWGPHL